jgi:transposase
VLAAVAMIDDLDREIAAIDRELKRLGVEHAYVPLLMSVPGIAWVLGYTIASEIGDIARFASPKKLCSYTGLCPASTNPATPTTAARSPTPARSTCAGR